MDFIDDRHFAGDKVQAYDWPSQVIHLRPDLPRTRNV